MPAFSGSAIVKAILFVNARLFFFFFGARQSSLHLAKKVTFVACFYLFFFICFYLDDIEFVWAVKMRV